MEKNKQQQLMLKLIKKIKFDKLQKLLSKIKQANLFNFCFTLVANNCHMKWKSVH